MNNIPLPFLHNVFLSQFPSLTIGPAAFRKSLVVKQLYFELKPHAALSQKQRE